MTFFSEFLTVNSILFHHLYFKTESTEKCYNQTTAGSMEWKNKKKMAITVIDLVIHFSYTFALR